MQSWYDHFIAIGRRKCVSHSYLFSSLNLKNLFDIQLSKIFRLSFYDIIKWYHYGRFKPHQRKIAFCLQRCGIKYANLWRSRCRRRPGCLNSLLFILVYFWPCSSNSLYIQVFSESDLQTFLTLYGYGVLASTTGTVTTTPQIKNLIGRVRKSNGAARATRTFGQVCAVLCKTKTWNYHIYRFACIRKSLILCI